MSVFAACQKESRPLDEKSAITTETQNAFGGSTHPNIVLIVGDDVGYSVLGCDGGHTFQTPNLDNMAAQGRRFTQCHASPLCSPSRSALLTGKYNFRNYTEWGFMDRFTNKTIGNMLQDAGYATCYAGKWQLSGYDASIRALGWEKYCVWQPGGLGKASGSRYKSPHLYQNAAYLPDELTLNKYADDMFLDYINGFIDTVTKPFFVYYSMSLVHEPWCPTPDDPEFAAWDPNNPGDVKFFPSMMKYMDREVGKLIKKAGPNTIVLYVGDNGSELQKVDTSFHGTGGKGSCTEAGTHVPLILYQSDYTSSSVDTSLIDLTDFLPTLASIAQIPVPETYGTLDGIPFYPNPSNRQTIYYHYNPCTGKHDEVTIWVQSSTYKRYDSTVRDKDSSKRNKLFNMRLDPDELHPIWRRNQTPGEKIIDSTFRSIIRYYARQQ